MEVTLMLNGKEIKTEIDEKIIMEALRNTKQTGYERVQNANYYYSYIGRNGTGHTVDVNDCYDESRYENADYYSDEEIAKLNIRADALMRKLRRFAAEHGGCVSPKQVFGRPTFTINYIGNKHFKCVPYIQSYPTIPIFATIEATKLAIKEFHDELVWFFEEYDPMPNGWWDNDPEAY